MSSYTENKESDQLIKSLIKLKKKLDEKEKVEEVLESSEKKFKEFIELLPQVVFEIDLEGNILFSNQKGYEKMGYKKEEMESGVKASQLISPQDRERLKENMNRIIRGERIQGEVYTAIKKDGNTFPVAAYTTPIFEEGEVTGLRGILIDKSEEKKYKEWAEYYKKIDRMTGLYNQDQLYYQLTTETQRANRYNRPLSIIMIEPLDFHFYKETYGHLEANRILTRFGTILNEAIRKTDSAYRYSSEVFAIIFPETSNENLYNIAERIKSDLEEEEFEPRTGEKFSVRVALGGAHYVPNEPIEEFLNKADYRLSIAKEKQDRTNMG